MIGLGLGEAMRDSFNEEQARKTAEAYQQAWNVFYQQYQQQMFNQAARQAAADQQAASGQYWQAYQQWPNYQYPPFVPPLAAPAPLPRWCRVLGLTLAATRAEAERAYRTLAKKAHPDLGGSTEAMQELNVAIAEARRSLI